MAREVFNMIRFGSDAVGPVLNDPDAREHLRSDLHRGIEQINQLLAEGKHITKLSYTVYTEGQGLDILVEFDQDVVKPGEHSNPFEGLE
jgi:hypothetical protein